MSFFCVAMVLLLFGCKKESAPENFSCTLTGNLTTPATLTGNASTSFAGSKFLITMSGPYSAVISIAWYNIDSPGAERGITSRAYTISADTLSAPVASASYAPQNPSYGGVFYNTGAGTGGTVTITGNTGPGGVISGTYSFTALNPYYPFDTVYLSNGAFTNVPVAKN